MNSNAQYLLYMDRSTMFALCTDGYFMYIVQMYTVQCTLCRDSNKYAVYL